MNPKSRERLVRHVATLHRQIPDSVRNAAIRCLSQRPAVDVEKAFPCRIGSVRHVDNPFPARNRRNQLSTFKSIINVPSAVHRPFWKKRTGCLRVPIAGCNPVCCPRGCFGICCHIPPILKDTPFISPTGGTGGYGTPASTPTFSINFSMSPIRLSILPIFRQPWGCDPRRCVCPLSQPGGAAGF